MTTYKYTARTIANEKRKGVLDVADEKQLANVLRQEGLFLLQCRETAATAQTTKLGAAELSDFCRQISTMLASGITIVKALNIMVARDLKPKVRNVYQALCRSLQQGNTLSEAMEEQNGVFPIFLVNMIRSGEASGRMDQTAAKMASHYEKEHRLNNKIRSATTYPIILLCLLVVVMIAIFTLVLPKFFTMYGDMPLPLPTRIVIGVSDFLVGNWLWVLIGVLLLVLVVSRLIKVPQIRYDLDRFKLRLPLLGKHVKIIYTARFSRNLSSLYSSGLPLLQALDISSTIIGNTFISRQFTDVTGKVRNGEMLSRAIGGVQGFDSKLSSTIFVGEETGHLDDMLDSVADSFDYEAEVATQKMVTILEPALIVTMAIFVGVVMISVMLPIFQLYSQIG